MMKTVVTALALAGLAGAAASAAEITDATKCKSEVEIVKELDANHDLGEKFEAVGQGLIGVLEDLCEKKDFKSADELAELIRGMYATE